MIRFVNGVELTLLQGDITQVEAEATVNAANEALAGGGGVDGAIHRAAGPALVEEERKLGRCPTGSAVATGAGNMRARYIFHAVGPIYNHHDEPEELLRSAYQSCLDLAEQYQIKSIVFPSLSTGAYMYPMTLASQIALETVINHLQKSSSLRQVKFALFGSNAYDKYARTLGKMLPE